MGVKILSLKDISQDEWNKFVMNSQNGTVFNTIEWARVWDSSFQNARPLFLLLKENGLQAAMPLIEIQKFGFKSYYSMPYGDYGGLILRGQSPTSRDADKSAKSVTPPTSRGGKVRSQELKIISGFVKLARGRWGMLSVADFYGETEELESIGFKKIKSTTHILPLCADGQAIWEKKVSPSKRRLVRQAQKKGIKISLVRDEHEVQECYRMLEETARRHEMPGPRFPLTVYMNIFNLMGEFLRWSIAKKDDMSLANAIHFVYKDSIVYWDGGSYGHGLQYRPNDALIWDCIKWGCENGYKYYNLGGSPRTGLVKFKEGWGAKEKHYWFYYKKSMLFKTLSCLRKMFFNSKSASKKVCSFLWLMDSLV